MSAVHKITRNLEITNKADGTWLHFINDSGKSEHWNIRLKLGAIAEQWSKEYYKNVIERSTNLVLLKETVDEIEDSIKNILADPLSDEDYNTMTEDVYYIIRKLIFAIQRLPDENNNS